MLNLNGGNMENEEKQNDTKPVVSEQEKVEENTNNYIEAIKEIKTNSVPKADYDKVVAENKQLLDSLVNGEPGPKEEVKEDINVDELKKDLLEKPMTNMEYIEKALKLRNELIEKEGIDIFVGSGKKYVPTNEDYETAQKVADVFQSCLDVAQGNPEVFNRELERVTIDAAPKSGINNKIRR